VAGSSTAVLLSMRTFMLLRNIKDGSDLTLLFAC